MATSANNPMIVFGGSFDPVHLGHIAVAEHIAKQCESTVRLMPCYQSPTKTQRASSSEDRLLMLHLATLACPNLVIDTRELAAERPTYTIDTMQQLRAEITEEQSLIFVMGMDSLVGLDQWKSWQELLTICHFYVVNRPGFSLEQNPAVQANIDGYLTQDENTLLESPSGKIFLDPSLALKVSSSAIRATIKDHQAVDQSVLHPEVLHFIQQQKLYEEQ